MCNASTEAGNDVRGQFRGGLSFPSQKETYAWIQGDQEAGGNLTTALVQS